MKHFDDLGKRSMLALECIERTVQVQQPHVMAGAFVRDLDSRIPRHPRLASAALGRAERPRVIDQHLAHDTRHQGEKVGTVGDGGLDVPEQLDERLVDERRWLERVAGPLTPHERPRDPPQLGVDERHQLVKRALISLAQALERASRDAIDPNASADVGECLLTRARILRALGRIDEAGRDTAAAQAHFRTTLPPDHPLVREAAASVGSLVSPH